MSKSTPITNRTEQTYNCMKCKHRFKGKVMRMDGKSCPKCYGPILPVSN